MINELISMNGYGHFVWSSFIFTFFSFFALFLITKKQLIKESNKFAKKSSRTGSALHHCNRLEPQVGGATLGEKSKP